MLMKLSIPSANGKTLPGVIKIQAPRLDTDCSQNRLCTTLCHLILVRLGIEGRVRWKRGIWSRKLKLSWTHSIQVGHMTRGRYMTNEACVGIVKVSNLPVRVEDKLMPCFIIVARVVFVDALVESSFNEVHVALLPSLRLALDLLYLRLWGG